MKQPHDISADEGQFRAGGQGEQIAWGMHGCMGSLNAAERESTDPYKERPSEGSILPFYKMGNTELLEPQKTSLKTHILLDVPA